ncbi:histidine phosphatase family protein [Kitasatospora kifunensis]|uniref:Putative phosphoglycerate mutase n=1 Tax=Kitasatospora kifunensis TaxID=58351 RepID=A0A7W7R085_KITKI|nr:histidine phosphatase family protein [Kitasatospora kifunensis]MBB4923047.1 putative phosphoglycerate mutase [Kitasatospora kifunensis]
MTASATRYLYLARHGEALPEQSGPGQSGPGLSENGRRQAVLLGRRLRDVPLAAVHHGPLPRAAQTARLVGEQLGAVPLRVDEAAGDYLPCVPGRAELPADSADLLLDFLGEVSQAEREHGAALAAEAIARFTGPVAGEVDRHELVVTHAFLVGWLVRHALDAPDWRWLGHNSANAALTVIRYAPGRPATVITVNDQRHLPTELRWTGFPPEWQI